jgi:hypothetical protein
MSSISSAIYSRPSPRDLLQNQLVSGLANGSVKTEDKSALSTAIDTIDTSLRSQRSSAGGRSERGERKSPEDAINKLIQQQVESGALTAAQATELKQVFSDAFSKSRPDGLEGVDGAGGPRGPKPQGGPPPGPPPGDKPPGGKPPSENDNDDATVSSSSDATDALAELLKSLKALIDKNATYSKSGSSQTKSSFSALLLNIQA